MSRIKNLMEYSAVGFENTLESLPSIGRNPSTRIGIGLLLTRLSKKNRIVRRYFGAHRFIALVLLVGIALTITLALGAKPASADSIACGINEITFTTGGVNDKPAINSDGTRIVFASDRDVTGENADLNFEIFLHDTTTNSFTQITHTTLSFEALDKCWLAGSEVECLCSDQQVLDNVCLNCGGEFPPKRIKHQAKRI